MKAAKRTITAIPELTSAVFDTGRRGNPKPGCDCVQCFGYCLTDPDVAIRHRLDTTAKPVHPNLSDIIWS